MGSSSKTLLIWLTALRPRQWIKNGLVFVGLVFSLNLTNPPAVWRAVVAFAVLCALASSAYLINDAADAPRDRLHPLKARRPIAAGLIAPATAVRVAGALLLGALAVAAALGWGFFLVGLSYIVLTAVYTLWLKHVTIVDLFTVATGFVLRAAAGAVVLQVLISPWLLLCTFLGALFIVTAKRRHELATLEDGAMAHRASLSAMSVPFLDEMMLITAACSIVVYSLYTFSERPDRPPLLMLTIPLVIYGIFRYLYLVRVGGLGGSPEEALLGDRPLLITVALWATLSAAILYLGPR
ncbi:MAG TPA: decaprenyl-phosphate phosphoribosyltransferase [Chloroflexota bacterium]|nr:decaprenyl-phosphate phosphoribosyltransferase [Chloroflexota bacterium]